MSNRFNQREERLLDLKNFNFEKVKNVVTVIYTLDILTTIKI